MTNQQKLIDYIKLLSEEQAGALLDAAHILLDSQNESPTLACPYCGSINVIHYGHKCGKQRYFCKDCRRVFMPTTNTIMSHSHFPTSIWKEVIADTVSGHAMDYSAKRLGISHQAVFGMRHKILLALQELPIVKDAMLSDVSELDETYVLDCFKGRRLSPQVCRKARRHGAKASRRGLSGEYVCICTAIQRKGCAYAESVNRAKPDSKEIKQIYSGHIANGTLLLCDGLRSYNVLPSLANCTVKDCNSAADGEKCFYNLNTANGFHSFIKHLYDFYRGVATKYLNRYNALFAAAYRNAEGLTSLLKNTLLTVSRTNHYHSNKDVREAKLLVI